MPPAGFALWNWFANNKYAQIAAAVIGALLLLRWKEEVDEARGRAQQARRSEKAARKTKDKVIENLEEKNDERLEKAERARASVPDADVLDSMSDEEYEFLFGRERDSDGS